MEYNDGSEFNPFDGPKKQRYPLTKQRSHANNNPFQFHRNDYSELGSKTTIKSKPRPKHYLQLEEHPFEKEGKVPFKRDEDRIPPANSGLNNNRSISKNKSSNDDDKDNINLRPNINIYYICDGSFLKNSPFQNRDTHHETESNKREKVKKDKKSIFNSKSKKNEKENEYNSFMDNDAPAPILGPMAPNDSVSDLSENLGKLELDDKLENPFNIIFNQKKENDGDFHLGDYYMD